MQVCKQAQAAINAEGNKALETLPGSYEADSKSVHVHHYSYVRRSIL